MLPHKNETEGRSDVLLLVLPYLGRNESSTTSMRISIGNKLRSRRRVLNGHRHGQSSSLIVEHKNTLEVQVPTERAALPVEEISIVLAHGRRHTRERHARTLERGGSRGISFEEKESRKVFKSFGLASVIVIAIHLVQTRVLLGTLGIFCIIIKCSCKPSPVVSEEGSEFIVASLFIAMTWGRIWQKYNTSCTSDSQYEYGHNLETFLNGFFCSLFLISLLQWIQQLNHFDEESWTGKFHTRSIKAAPQVEVCVVCLEDIKSEGECKLLSCGHSFHHECANRWIRSTSRLRPSCPCCRSEIDH